MKKSRLSLLPHVLMYSLIELHFNLHIIYNFILLLLQLNYENLKNFNAKHCFKSFKLQTKL